MNVFGFKLSFNIQRKLARAAALGSLTAAAFVLASCEKEAARLARDNPFPSTYVAGEPRDILFTNATVLDGAGRRFDNADVLVRGGKVISVGAGREGAGEAEIIDASGKWITPGLIDPHSHLGIASMPFVPDELPVWDVNETTDPNGADMWAEHAVRVQDPAFSRALAGGVTTLQILPGSANLFGGRGVVLKNTRGVTVQDLKFPDAPYGMKMACGENPKFTYGEEGRFPASRMGVVAGMRRAWAAASADGADNETDERKATLRAAMRGELRVHIHCYRAEDIAYLFDISREFGFKITAIHHATEAYKIPQEFRRADACAVIWSDWWGYKLEAYDGIRANAAILEQAGVCVALHSDSPSLGQRLNVEMAKAVAGGVRIGIEIAPERAIQWVTLNAAKVIGLDDRIGSLESGKNADLVVWSGDVMSVYSRADMVMIDGVVQYDRQSEIGLPVSDIELGQPAQEFGQ